MIPDAGANVTLAPGDVAGAPVRPGGHLHLSGYTLLRPESRDGGARRACVRPRPPG